MIGVYKIKPERISEMNNGTTFMILKGCLAISIVFIAIISAKNEEGMLFSMLIVIVGMAFMIILGLLLRYFMYDPILNTEIEITEQGLIRRGTDLLTVRIKFEDIGRAIRKPNGTILFRKGLASAIQPFILNRITFTNNFDVLFIPHALDNYEKVLAHIEKKIP